MKVFLYRDSRSPKNVIYNPGGFPGILGGGTTLGQVEFPPSTGDNDLVAETKNDKWLTHRKDMDLLGCKLHGILCQISPTHLFKM